VSCRLRVTYGNVSLFLDIFNGSRLDNTKPKVSTAILSICLHIYNG